MKEVEAQTQNLINMIKNCNEYNQYIRLQKNIMQDPLLYDKLNEFRRKSLVVQFGNEADLDGAMYGLTQEYSDLLQNPMATDFLFAEQQYCKLIRFVQTKIIQSTEIDIDFLEG